jgi:hypothetical protein
MEKDMSGSFVVMNDRLIEVARYKLAIDAYTVRTMLARTYKATYTVAYLPGDFSLGSQVIIDTDNATVRYTQKRR